MKKSVLVLEGGAMRSVYTSGVLDVFMENQIEFDCVVGVSAGALVGSNYISNQKGRTAGINITYCKDPKYMGIGAIRKNKGLVGFDYLFGEISKNKYPFDEETFEHSTKRFVIGATNCISGKTEFFEKDTKQVYTLLQASSSMPLVAQTVSIEGKPYLDGAIDCNVPIEWAIKQGYEKIVVVLTRNRNYQKEALSNRMKKVYGMVYKQYPELLKSIYDRPSKYNQTYAHIAQLEKENRIMVLQPQNEVKVARLEKDPDKLKSLYQHGIEEAKRRLGELKMYLEE